MSVLSQSVASVTPSGMTSRTSVAISEALAGRLKGPRAVLAFMGPAVIASIAYMDPGNYATNIGAGAGYGYALIWVVVMANLVAMLFQAADEDSATGGPDLVRGIYPTMATITAEGFEPLATEEVAERFRSLLDDMNGGLAS